MGHDAWSQITAHIVSVLGSHGTWCSVLHSLRIHPCCLEDPLQDSPNHTRAGCSQPVTAWPGARAGRVLPTGGAPAGHLCSGLWDFLWAALWSEALPPCHPRSYPDPSPASSFAFQVSDLQGSGTFFSPTPAPVSLLLQRFSLHLNVMLVYASWRTWTGISSLWKMSSFFQVSVQSWTHLLRPQLLYEKADLVNFVCGVEEFLQGGKNALTLFTYLF